MSLKPEKSIWDRICSINCCSNPEDAQNNDDMLPSVIEPSQRTSVAANTAAQTTRPAKLVMIHGYSDKGESFAAWKAALAKSHGYSDSDFLVCSYASLANEISIKDVAEGFDRALLLQTGLDKNEPFSAIVHSTGMLVIRSWLAADPSRYSRLKHLIALAPATFGSPLAHKGRSWLGAVFKGNRERGPDFLETGDAILDGLELGSRFTWDLAHLDTVGDDPPFGSGPDSPYVFVFCGNKGYTGISRLANQVGTDGTVRWAGCALNSRKVVVDMSEHRPPAQRIKIEKWLNQKIPLIPVAGLNHGTIMSKPTEGLVAQVAQALTVGSEDEFNAWLGDHHNNKNQQELMAEWQQVVMRVVDDRGDPIPDYNFELFSIDPKTGTEMELDLDLKVHVYSGDSSLRCFHLDLKKAKEAGAVVSEDDNARIFMRIIASSGSERVGYVGCNHDGKWDAVLEITALLTAKGAHLFHAFTTTLLEVRLNREPLPLVGPNKVLWFH